MKILSSISNLTFLFAVICFSACNPPATKQFHGIYADEENGLRNPERGLRLEVALDVESWDKEKTPSITARLEQEAQKYASDSITLVQTYFYLTDIANKPLEQKHFEAMQIFLDKLRELGMKAALRFAYEKDFMGRIAFGPTEADIKQHTQQLKPFLEANKDVILVVQAGFIGAWGEWHSSVHGLENSETTKKNILQLICDMTPEDRMIQIRVPSYKNLLKGDANYHRLSFHDDFIVIKPHVWDGDMSEESANFAQIVKESPYLIVDGELPWGFWSVNQDPDNKDSGWLIDGAQVARRLFLQHYTSLSAIHNYKERNDSDKFSMLYWKETPISETFLTENKMPFSPAYFLKKDGTKAARSEFEYIRDHLGYRIELQQLKTNLPWKKGAANQVEVSLINRGFSTLFNEHPVSFVLIDSAGKVCASALTSANVNDWQPYAPQDVDQTPLVHHVSASITLPSTLPAGAYRLGLWIPDGAAALKYNPQYAIRCANSDVEWLTTTDGLGVNSLISVSVE
ncbi:MAG: DUF4832 domain-containing protein [Prevotellaceae bacterium]|jgi:hypothetical protein|nr:DUF4832 domain-containing protein [Prevotellaceae bacterium]